MGEEEQLLQIHKFQDESSSGSKIYDGGVGGSGSDDCLQTSMKS
jgi:hypothetical protein